MKVISVSPVTVADPVAINEVVADTVVAHLNYEHACMATYTTLQERGKKATVATTFLNCLGIRKAIKYSIQDHEYKLYEL